MYVHIMDTDTYIDLLLMGLFILRSKINPVQFSLPRKAKVFSVIPGISFSNMRLWRILKFSIQFESSPSHIPIHLGLLLFPLWGLGFFWRYKDFLPTYLEPQSALVTKLLTPPASSVCTGSDDFLGVSFVSSLFFSCHIQSNSKFCQLHL